jgi:site-specific DNA recombinase
LYNAIENGAANLSEPMPKDRVAELTAVGDHARADAERTEGAADRLGPTITPLSWAGLSGKISQRC